MMPMQGAVCVTLSWCQELYVGQNQATIGLEPVWLLGSNCVGRGSWLIPIYVALVLLPLS